MTAEKPPYVLPCADPVEEPPYYFGTEQRPWSCFGLFLPTQKGVLDALCNRLLNEPLAKNCNEDVRFEPIGSDMLCSINLYRQAGSVPQPHEGWVEYLELTFMFKVRRTTPEDQDGQLTWCIPVLFLDGTKETGSRSVIYAITGGREIFGLAKTAGAIKLVIGGGFTRLKHARLQVIDLPYGQTDPAPLRRVKILRVKPEIVGPADVEPPPLTHLALIAKLLGVSPEDLDQESGLVPELGNLRYDENQVFGGPLLGLKQFHYAKDYPKASFQAVVQSDYRLTDEPVIQSLYSDHVVRFWPSENVRLVDDLGLKVDNNEIRVPSDDSFYLEAQALFGDPAKTHVWGCP